LPYEFAEYRATKLRTLFKSFALSQLSAAQCATHHLFHCEQRKLLQDIFSPFVSISMLYKKNNLANFLETLSARKIRPPPFLFVSCYQQEYLKGTIAKQKAESK